MSSGPAEPGCPAPKEGGAVRRLSYLFVLILATMLKLPTNAVVAPPQTGHFPIEGYIAVLEPQDFGVRLPPSRI
jgi:hypothetical protein